MLLMLFKVELGLIYLVKNDLKTLDIINYGLNSHRNIQALKPSSPKMVIIWHFFSPKNIFNLAQFIWSGTISDIWKLKTRNTVLNIQI